MIMPIQPKSAFFFQLWPLLKIIIDQSITLSHSPRTIFPSPIFPPQIPCVYTLSSSKSKQYIPLLRRKARLKMSIVSRIKALVKCWDVFGTSEFLRYQKSNKFQTLTGGTITLAIVIIAIVCLLNMIHNLSDRATINATSTVTQESLQTPARLADSPQSKFMFGVRVAKLNGNIVNLSQEKQFFDVRVTEESSSSGGSSSKEGLLVKCTRQHWISHPDVILNYDLLQVDSWLCPSPAFSFSLAGNPDITSDTVSIDISACNATYSSANCASPKEMDQFFENNANFKLKLYFINTIINPFAETPAEHHLSDSKDAIFSASLGSLTSLYFSNYQIETDQSGLSSKDTTIQRGVMLGEDITHQHFMPSAGMPIARITLNKSPLLFLFQRSHQKLAIVFAYFGGITSFAIIMFYLIKPYVQTYYQLSLSNEIFSSDSPFKTFHIFKFLALKVYELLKATKLYCRWSLGNELIEVKEEIKQHLNVVQLIKRVLLLENMMLSLFDEFELEDRISCTITMEEAKALRVKLKSYEKPHCMKISKSPINVQKSFPTLFQPQPRLQKEDSQYQQIVLNQKKLLQNQFKIRLKAVTMLNNKIEPDFKLIESENIKISPMIEEPPYLAKLSRQIEEKEMNKDSERERFAGRAMSHKLRMRFSTKGRVSGSNASEESRCVERQ